MKLRRDNFKGQESNRRFEVGTIECDYCINWYSIIDLKCPKCGSKNYELERRHPDDGFNAPILLNYGKQPKIWTRVREDEF